MIARFNHTSNDVSERIADITIVYVSEHIADIAIVKKIICNDVRTYSRYSNSKENNTSNDVS